MCKYASQRQAAGVLRSGASAYPTKRSCLICSDWNSGRISFLPGLLGKASCWQAVLNFKFKATILK